MARRKGEIQLQQEIETQEEWEDMLSKEGLCVVDVYQEWSGPVTPLVANLRRLKNELGDDLLKFAVAKADTIDALEKYRGRCEPCFLFYAGGVLVAVVRGANAPLILRTITEQLAQEHKVLDGQAERKEIKDPMIAIFEAQDKQAADEEEEKEEEGKPKTPKGKGEEARKEVSVVIIKPDAITAGKKDEIIEEMKSRGIEILREEDRHLTEDEVKNLYTHLQDEEYFEDLVKFMSSSPCCVLAITKGRTGENIIKEFRELIGPTEVEAAKEQAPDSLRAKYGSDKYMNAVHSSDSSDTAARELAFFFPDFVAPAQEGRPKVQRTLALIRPDAYKAHKDEIMAKIREAGFKIAMSREVNFTKEQAEEFYSEHQGQEYFDELTTRMSSGPMLALGLAREDAIAGWRQMLGPTRLEEAKEQAPDSLRAQFSVDDVPLNQLHGSDSLEHAEKEIQYFFPMEQTVAVIKPDAYGTKDEIIDKIHDAGFRIAARKETTLSREVAEEFYADHKDKEYYNDLVEHMVSGPTYFMVLSREGAVDGWRSLIGHTDPEQARTADPDSIRGKLGQSILLNAVHGSSTSEHAKQSIQKIFGDLKFNTDGTLAEEEEGESTEQKPSGETQDQQQTEEPPKPEPQPEEAPKEEEQTPATQDDTAKDDSKPAEQSEEPKADDKPAEEQQAAEDKPADTQDQQQAAEDKPADTQDKQQAEDTQKEQQAEGDGKPDESPAEPQEEKTAEEPKADEQKADEPKPEESKDEQPKEEEQKADEQKAEEPKAEEPKAEEPKADDQQKADEAPAQQGEAKPEEEKKAEGEQSAGGS